MSGLRVPVATFRLQFHPGFGFNDARNLISYLDRLGISDIYASPLLKPRHGSLHGYDVTDPSRLNPELGSFDEFASLVGDLQANHMGLLLDIVPNHMAGGDENPWWTDVQEKGGRSQYSNYFDLDWLSFDGKVLSTAGHRRFFDIGELAGVRVEIAEVFEKSHALILDLISRGMVTGLRIDHIDGLAYPRAYLEQLQRAISGKEKTRPADSFYILVEKILSDDETLPPEWPVAGTTGYDFANSLAALLTDGTGLKALAGIYSLFTGNDRSFEDIVYEKKKQVIDISFSREFEALGRYLLFLSTETGNSVSKGLSAGSLSDALAELTACLPVYRTYISDHSASEADRLRLEYVLSETSARTGPRYREEMEFIRTLLLRDTAFGPPEQDKQALDFVIRWQQLTGSVMAKGYEDTALYCYNRLISLDEVGGNPGADGLSIDDFHLFNMRRLAGYPHSMNLTSSHDTKRSEDVRSRISVLAELSHEWGLKLSEWSRMNQSAKAVVNGTAVPEPETETFIYQTMLGAWPLSEGEVPEFRTRLKEYMIKATKEAKTFTNWISPNEEYEKAVIGFVDHLFRIAGDNRFLPHFLEFEEKMAFFGMLNSLSQVLLKITSPGVPDFYQGNEFWDFSLVDPDNRRPVDFKRRMEMLERLEREAETGLTGLLESVQESWRDGWIKMYLTWRALRFRREHIELFRSGEYLPLRVEGDKKDHVIAFARRLQDGWAVIAAPRLCSGLVGVGEMPCGPGVWNDGAVLLPDGSPTSWRDCFTERRVSPQTKSGLMLADIFCDFPYALLESAALD